MDGGARDPSGNPPLATSNFHKKTGALDRQTALDALGGPRRGGTFLQPPAVPDTTILLCINLVLPMGWVNSPDMFCTASDRVTDMANGYILDPTSAF